MSLSNQELLLRAEALGFLTATDKEGNVTITAEGNSRWFLALQRTGAVSGGGDRWLLVVQNSPQISFYPEDALRFLNSQHRKSN